MGIDANDPSPRFNNLRVAGGCKIHGLLIAWQARQEMPRMNPISGKKYDTYARADFVKT